MDIMEHKEITDFLSNTNVGTAGSSLIEVVMRKANIDTVGKLAYDKSYDIQFAIIEALELHTDFGSKVCRKVVDFYVDSTKELILTRKESSKQKSLFSAILGYAKMQNNLKS